MYVRTCCSALRRNELAADLNISLVLSSDWTRYRCLLLRRMESCHMEVSCAVAATGDMLVHLEIHRTTARTPGPATRYDALLLPCPLVPFVCCAVRARDGILPSVSEVGLFLGWYLVGWLEPIDCRQAKKCEMIRKLMPSWTPRLFAS